MCLSIIWFISGVAIGSAYTIRRAAHKGGATSRSSLDAHRVSTARRRFGQIANRESIREARKLANKAIEEIGETKC